MLVLLSMFLSFFSWAQAEESSQVSASQQNIHSEEEYKIVTPEQMLEAEAYFAEHPFSDESIGRTATTPVTEGIVNCFDYYTFGSVQVDVGPTVGTTVPGVPLTFIGTLKNDNSYPIVDGQVMVKIFKTDTTSDVSLVQHNGYPVVDQFYVLDHVSLPAQGEKPITFTWNVPAFAETGEYELAAYFMTAKRFNLLGLPFTDDVTGNKATFSISSGESSGVAFDKNSVTLNDIPHNFAEFPLHFTKDEPVTATLQIKNTTNKTQTVPVIWTLSNWAGERIENQLDQIAETVTLKPKETKTLTYTATKATGAVSFLHVEAQYQDTSSILNIRFVRDGRGEIRLNFPSITSYPLTAGQENTIFSCLHSTSEPLVEGGELTLTISDMRGNTIHSYTYQGGITGEMMGVKDAFVPAKNISDFILTATLKHNGTLVEKVSAKYSCTDIDPSLCVNEDLEMAEGESTSALSWLIGLVVLCVFTVLAFVGFKIYQGRKKLPAVTIVNPK
jgi:hypothetical protein